MTAESTRAEPAPSPAELRPGDRIGRYVVEGLLGSGGMGVVVAAHDPELARQVAVKLVRPGAGDRPYRQRLVREARAMAKLEHDNVVRVYDAGEHDGEVFVAMELVRGETVGRWMRAAPRPWREVLARFVAA
ncbi:MAG TPA: protein kinase, partial [Kofleriaceae bacterium]